MTEVGPPDATEGTRPAPELWPAVVSATELSNSFLGGLLEICVVTRDHRRTMEGLVRLGIGPWRVHTFGSRTVTGRTYRGAEADWAIKVCFADVGDLALEIMQPLRGPSIFQEYLDEHGEGIQHIAFDVEKRPWDDRLADFAGRGFPVTQSGRFMDANAFAFFDTERLTGTTFETYDIPHDFDWPEPEAWFPGPPPARVGPGTSSPTKESAHEQ
jgi:methylmalonyl-CoA/ethylmalonyl-CoA epimerase